MSMQFEQKLFTGRLPPGTGAYIGNPKLVIGTIWYGNGTTRLVQGHKKELFVKVLFSLY
jgi:hypothetical protein